MKKLNVYPLLFILLAFTACNPNQTSSLVSPAPKELVKNPVYKRQLKEIDLERLKKDQESFSELIKENRVTKVPNGTKPIIVKVERETLDENGEALLDKNGDPVIEPAHDKQKVEEYYILKEGEVTPEESVEESETEEVIVEETLEEVTVEENEPEGENLNIIVDLEDRDSKVSPIDRPVKEKEPKKDDGKVVVVDENPKTKPEVKKEEEVFAKLPEKVTVPTRRPKKRPAKKKPKEDSKKYGKYKADWDGRSTQKRYTRYVLEGLEKYGANLLNPKVKMRNYRKYCRNYNNLNREERKRFWLMMISGLSGLESGFDTNEKYKEKDESIKDVISRGLLQISIKSSKQSIYRCDKKVGIRRTSDLHNSKKNLVCGVVIMNHWILRDKKIYGKSDLKICTRGTNKGKRVCRDWYGVGRYWGPIRKAMRLESKPAKSLSRRDKEVLSLQKKTQKLNFCR